MADSWGRRIRLTIFGESHGPGVGAVLEGLPAGMPVDEEAIRREMARRAPGGGGAATTRREADEVEILSGLYEGKTTGTALCGIIRNNDAKSGDYGSILRPGHADWTALLKYGGHADMRGGGHFSGRLTAPLVFAGALAKQWLTQKGVAVHGRIAAIGGLRDDAVPESAEAYAAAAQKDFPVYSDAAGQAMWQAIMEAKADRDSTGGEIAVAAFGLPGGLGDPFFDSLESVAAALAFSVPAVKGVAFGDGFALAGMRGSAANDELLLKDGRITAATNHNGGILGGITNGMPVVMRLAVKPTPSIGRAQHSVDGATLQEAVLETHGRHDACIVPRAVPVAEAVLALALADCMPEGGA